MTCSNAVAAEFLDIRHDALVIRGIRDANLIDITSIQNTGKVIFGTTVHLVNMETDEEVTYQIVGEDEADIKAGKLSVSSPIARALIGKNEGDVVAIRIPSGTVEYEISEVEYI